MFPVLLPVLWKVCVLPKLPGKPAQREQRKTHGGVAGAPGCCGQLPHGVLNRMAPMQLRPRAAPPDACSSSQGGSGDSPGWRNDHPVAQAETPRTAQMPLPSFLGSDPPPLLGSFQLSLPVSSMTSG